MGCDLRQRSLPCTTATGL
uniref:Uncharacterized protein n=1 Tax=Anguilla anguilla TaxID=7936 RepID=A0A0E9SY28_ANGAN